jgi:hypothetical protein
MVSAVRTLRLLLVGSYTVAIVACGSRTGLLVPTDDGPGAPSNDTSVHDAGPQRAPSDALPPIDVTPAPIPSDCPDASATLVYVITDRGTLLSFDPQAATFASIGTIACGSSSTPNSMAVDHTGIAYVGFRDGAIFRVSTRTAVCQATPFAGTPQNSPFGMGFASNAGGAGETLYIAQSLEASGLGSVDTTTFAFRSIGPFYPEIPNPELTGTGAGDLFAFSAAGQGSVIAQIDKATARVVAETPLAGVVQGSGWAFAFWGGDFYTFTAPAAPTSIVTRYRPGDGSVVQVARYPTTIVGAGVSTCAPQQ